MDAIVTSARLPFLKALPPYPGGKRWLLPGIFGLIEDLLPRTSWAQLTICGAFLGGGAVSVTAKALGFGRVLANDIAERSALVGRALLANARVRLTEASVLRLFDDGPVIDANPPRLLNRLPQPHSAFLQRAWQHLHGGSFTDIERDLIALLLMKWLLCYFPLGLPTATDAHRLVDGDFDPVTARRLSHYLGRGRRLLHPATLLTMAEDINRAILPGRADIFQRDVFDFLPKVKADLVYLDPPYAGTQSYEKAFALVDEYIGASPLPASSFSSSHPPLDQLLEACRQVPTLVLSLGNTLLDGDGVRALVSRHRRVHRILSLPYRHYGALASKDKNVANREFLILATQK